MTAAQPPSAQPPSAQSLVARLQTIRRHPVVFYDSALTSDAVPILYECLRRVGYTDDLDLVLSTGGGAITSTRQIAMLLREFTGRLTILVPYRARSAGTLLCLSADELVLGPLAELGPVDSAMDSAGPAPPDAPGTISAEDIRAFRSLAEDWFGVVRAEDQLQVLALLATRIFPTSLASFYRFDKLVREVAAELLEWQLAGDERRKEREGIVSRLVSGYHSHDAVLSRRDVRELGLRAVDATPEEEEILWGMSQLIRPITGLIPRSSRRPGAAQLWEEVTGVIAANDFCARHVVLRGGSGRSEELPAAVSQEAPVLNASWEIAG